MRTKTIKAIDIETMIEAAIEVMDTQGAFLEEALMDKLQEMRSNRYKNTFSFLLRKHIFNKANDSSFTINPLALIAWGEKHATQEQKKKALGWMKENVSDAAVDGSIWIPIDVNGATRGGKSSPLAGFKMLEKGKRNADGTPYLRYTARRSGGRTRNEGGRAAVDVVVPKTIASKVMKNWEKAEVLVNPEARQIALKKGTSINGYSIRWNGSPHYAQVSVYAGTAKAAAADLGLELKETTERVLLTEVEHAVDEYIIFELT